METSIRIALVAIGAFALSHAMAAAQVVEPASADVPVTEDTDGIVRLPARGELKDGQAIALSELMEGERPRGERLVPGGGLLMSFDTDRDGVVSDDELDAGIAAQYAAADANGDQRLTPLEQTDWAGALPTRDDSLANPVRFDPNLDRVVTIEEFDQVIRQLAAAYVAEGEDVLYVASLTAAEPDREEREVLRPLLRGERPEQRRDHFGPWIGAFRHDEDGWHYVLTGPPKP